MFVDIPQQLKDTFFQRVLQTEQHHSCLSLSNGHRNHGCKDREEEKERGNQSENTDMTQK